MVVVVLMGVVNIVGVVGTQGKHSVECNIEGEALVEVVEEVVVEKVAEKEPGVVGVVEFVGVEAAFGDRRWRGLLVGPQCRVGLRTFFGSPFPAFNSPLQICTGLHGFLFFLFTNPCFFFLGFAGGTEVVGVSIAADAGTAGAVALLDVGSAAAGLSASVPCFSGHLSPSPLVAWLLGPVLGLSSLFGGGGGGCCSCCCCCALLRCLRSSGGKTWQYGLIVYSPITKGVGFPPSLSSADLH